MVQSLYLAIAVCINATYLERRVTFSILLLKLHEVKFFLNRIILFCTTFDRCFIVTLLYCPFKDTHTHTGIHMKLAKNRYEVNKLY